MTLCVAASILTKREKEVFNWLIVGKSTHDIAVLLGISEKTVRNHISNGIQKLGVKGRAQAIVELLRLGELSL
ncbi:helix-turn-helix transcriptional regulator [Domibacillus antri]|uniref:Helix-turn-helix transcriptional regulator n=1 Tax=Domibacillus antri TaxID=1714264 RepID=A0A1Q8Q5P6_9BACI|nr:helix-turn-helix transcriptional regulator [Domibacillus antri]